MQSDFTLHYPHTQIYKDELTNIFLLLVLCLSYSVFLTHTHTRGKRRAVDLVLPGEPGSKRFCAPDVSWTTRGLPGSWRTNSARQPWCVCVCVCPHFISVHVFLCFLEASNASQLSMCVTSEKTFLKPIPPNRTRRFLLSLHKQENLNCNTHTPTIQRTGKVCVWKNKKTAK